MRRLRRVLEVRERERDGATRGVAPARAAHFAAKSAEPNFFGNGRARSVFHIFHNTFIAVSLFSMQPRHCPRRVEEEAPRGELA